MKIISPRDVFDNKNFLSPPLTCPSRIAFLQMYTTTFSPPLEYPLTLEISAYNFDFIKIHKNNFKLHILDIA